VTIAIEIRMGLRQTIDLRSVLRALVLAASVGIVLAHGCHGPNEDHELFARRLQRSTFYVSPMP